MEMDGGGWSGSLSENIWLDLKSTEVRRGFCFPKEIPVTDKDLYKSLTLQKQSSCYHCLWIFLFFIFLFMGMEVCYFNIVTFPNTLYVTINSNLWQNKLLQAVLDIANGS